MDKEVKKWLGKLEKVKKDTFDLSRDEDLSIALMNLISLEEHFYFTAMKTDDQKYLDMLNSVRELRKDLLGKIVTDPKGEEWCISKHLLAASMRLVEVGTKELSSGRKKQANEFFKRAFDLYSLFFGINLKLIDSKKLEKSSGKSSPLMNKMSTMVKKLIDCCKE
jgi:hypothetical protein